MNTDLIGGVIRAVLAAVGGYFVAKGTVDQGTFTTISGALVTLGTAIWSIYTNQTGKTIGTK